MRSETEKFTEYLKFTGRSAQVQFMCVEMKHPKAAVHLMVSWVFVIKSVQCVHSATRSHQ